MSGHVSTAGLVTLPYFVDRLMLGVSRRHPLARRRRIRFAEALDHESYS